MKSPLWVLLTSAATSKLRVAWSVLCLQLLPSTAAGTVVETTAEEDGNEEAETNEDVVDEVSEDAADDVGAGIEYELQQPSGLHCAS